MRLARESLEAMLGSGALAGKTFLDAGSGSGLFSLAATQLGAKAVVSFDYDPQSVACTRELKRRYFPDSDNWTIAQGDCLDEAFLESLPRADVVYSWGVLHHTGQMWQAIERVGRLTQPGGLFFLAIYNDQGWKSRVWRRIKKFYCGGRLKRWLVCAVFFPVFFVYAFCKDAVRLRNPFSRYAEPRARGMSVVRDWIDWLGGYPFEAATPGAVIDFVGSRGFALVKQQDVGRKLGCNEFVFRRVN